ncbi:metal ion permease [Photobacterium damselae]|uniref:Metal ion permease n=1 Tax=Photobacterium damselae TaxID=38293 RepID=A0ACD3T1Q6_PHODM|nr:permease [Photobacterium damselae]RDL28474.1 metal ion permease [Photobacterium damselae]TMX49419.1 metal ion permease [Photobacterium damselae]TMX66400.1 metal ion permease [Photobacterium damselae]TMX78581.1 metal ion permease [Photobacterium damselae]
MESGDGNIIFHTISVFFNMVWQVYWPLAFGLILSSFIRHLLPVETVAKNLGKTTAKSLSLTTVLGMVSSSCSYAAASLSHTLLSKKSTVANAMAFLVSSTNLIVEMFIVLVALLGWTFFWGEILGGLILIVSAAFLFERFYPKDVEQELRAKLAQEQEGSAGGHSDCGMGMSSMKSEHEDCGMDMSSMKHEHHDMGAMNMKGEHEDCGMDMSSMKHDHHDMDVMNMKGDHEDCGMDMSSMKHDHHDMSDMKPTEPQSPMMEKITKSAGFFQMDLAMIGKEILIGVVVSSILIAVVPLEGWRTLFISNDAALPMWLHSFLDVVIGIFVAMIAYVCSVGNLLLAAALWHGGISFGGVIGFILSDVLTIPMMKVYQKYYGKRPAKWMVGLLFIAILFTGLCVDAIFHGFDINVTTEGLRAINQDGFGLNLTTILNCVFIPLSIWYYRLGKKANAGTGMNM